MAIMVKVRTRVISRCIYNCYVCELINLPRQTHRYTLILILRSPTQNEIKISEIATEN